MVRPTVPLLGRTGWVKTFGSVRGVLVGAVAVSWSVVGVVLKQPIEFDGETRS